MTLKSLPNIEDMDKYDISDAAKAHLKGLMIEPLGKVSSFALQYILSWLDPVVVRPDAIRSQGRVSFGRSRAYTDGIAVYIGPKFVVENVDWDNTRFEKDTTRDCWGEINWDDADSVGRAVARIYWTGILDAAPAMSFLDPAIQLLCHMSAVHGRYVQIRRGVRAEGRVNFDAEQGEPGVALFVNSAEMVRGDNHVPAEEHIRSAYGRAPLSPARARRLNGTHTNDPERMKQY